MEIFTTFLRVVRIALVLLTPSPAQAQQFIRLDSGEPGLFISALWVLVFLGSIMGFCVAKILQSPPRRYSPDDSREDITPTPSIEDFEREPFDWREYTRRLEAETEAREAEVRAALKEAELKEIEEFLRKKNRRNRKENAHAKTRNPSADADGSDEA